MVHKQANHEVIGSGKVRKWPNLDDVVHKATNGAESSTMPAGQLSAETHSALRESVSDISELLQVFSM